MKALITGASSGLGAEFALQLAEMGYDLILVARREEKMREIERKVKVDVEIVPLDLSVEENCYTLYEIVKEEDVKVVINNAGFGLLGKFCENDLDKELEMINLNIKAVHILTKLFTQKFCSVNKGYILNVASIGGFMPGPLLATYYATKAYVVSLSAAVREELLRDEKNVYVGSLCPGPVDTEFSSVAGVKSPLRGASPKSIVADALNGMFGKKRVIIPGVGTKVLAWLSKALPMGFVTKISYIVQSRKT